MIETCSLVLNEFKQVSTRIRYDRYGRQPVYGPLPEEDLLSNSWADFEAMNSQEWANLRSLVDVDLAYDFLTYSVRMGTFAVRESDPFRIRCSCMGLIVDANLVESADLLDTATVTFDAASRLGVPLPETLNEVLKYATPERAATIRRMSSNFNTFYGLLSSGYECATTNEGLTYRKLPIKAPGPPLT
jgi:hypothetical protein